MDKKFFAIMAASLMLACAFIVPTQSDVEESDAVIGIDDLLIGALIVTAFAAGGAVVYAIDHYDGSSSNEDVVRKYESQYVAESLANNVELNTKWIQTLASAWKLTEEHHIRMAELSASELWAVGTPYDADKILNVSGVYLNSIRSLQDASNQTTALFTLLGDTMADWNGNDTYSGHMEFKISYGTKDISSKGSFGALVGQSTGIVQEGYQKIYIPDKAKLWFDAGTTIVSPSNIYYEVQKGWNTLDKMPGFEAGIYTITPGVTCIGDILPTLGSGAAPLKAGIMLKCGSEDVVLSYTADGLTDGKESYNSLKMTITADGSESHTVDLYSVVSDYQHLVNNVLGVMSSAASSAAAVWSIFNQAGQASAYLSTLMVPNEYDGVTLTVAQKAAMTTMAMAQLADFWQDNKGTVKTSDYSVATDMGLFVRGDVIDKTGTTLYTDVIYTPMFYTETDLSIGTYELKNQAILAIWGTGESLAGWSNTSQTAMVTATNGYKLVIKEMSLDGTSKSSMKLSIKEMDYIDPAKLKHDPVEPEGYGDLDRVVMTVMIVLGALIVLAGYRSYSYTIMIIGAIVIIAGVLFCGVIANFIYTLLGWRLLLW